MRRLRSAWFVLLISVAAIAQNSLSAPPQSARQALIEMLMGKGADDFIRHLPNDARKALIRKGETPESSTVLRIATAVHEIAGSAGSIKTFDEGPDILTSEDPNNHEKIEVAVERENLLGEEDEIELSFHSYRNGQPQALPVIPSLIFRLKQEDEIWRLTEAVVSARIPLSDPDYLVGLRKQQNEANESAVQMRISLIAQAETGYAAAHSDLGYTCSLSSLFPGWAREGAPAAFAVVTKEESNGYRFSLTGCTGKPATKYRLAVIPIDESSEMNAFCMDQSGRLKSIAAAESSNCPERGEFVTVMEAPVPD